MNKRQNKDDERLRERSAAEDIFRNAPDPPSRILAARCPGPQKARLDKPQLDENIDALKARCLSDEFVPGEKVHLIDDMPSACEGPPFVYYVGPHPTDPSMSVVMYLGDHFHMEPTMNLRKGQAPRESP